MIPVCEISNQLCNVFGVTANCSLTSCNCKSGYVGTYCQQCASNHFIWRGKNFDLKDGVGVECGKFFHIHFFKEWYFLSKYF